MASRRDVTTEHERHEAHVMNAPIPSSDLQFDVPHREQQDGSMDDILAEIRRHIMTHGKASSDTRARLGTPDTPCELQASSAPLSQMESRAPTLPIKPGLGAPVTANPGVEMPAQATTPQARSQLSRGEGTSLASPATEAAVAACFDALSASVAIRSTGLIDSLIRDMLRPLLGKWLDDNLPGIVERLVCAEIQRATRGGG